MSHRLTLQLTVDYDLRGVDPADMAANLQRLVERAIGEGLLTGETEAEVDTWSGRVIEDTELGDTGDVNSPDVIGVWLRSLDKDDHVYIDDDGMRLKVVDKDDYIELGGHTPEEEEPEKLPLTEEMFVAYLRENCEEIKPEEAFREVCLEDDGIGWRRAQNAQHGYERYCKLELDDKPAFRQGLNDYADSMVKGRSWVTFDNGETYFTDEAVKEAIAEFDGRPETYVPEPRIKDKIDFWL